MLTHEGYVSTLLIRFLEFAAAPPRAKLYPFRLPHWLVII
jgi:hypothetical protein